MLSERVKLFMQAYGWPESAATYVGRREWELEVYKEALEDIVERTQSDDGLTTAEGALSTGKAIRAEGERQGNPTPAEPIDHQENLASEVQ